MSALSSCRLNCGAITLWPPSPSAREAADAISRAASGSDGPESTTATREEWLRSSSTISSTKDAAGQRLNGLLALTCTVTISLRSSIPMSDSQVVTRPAASGS